MGEKYGVTRLYTDKDDEMPRSRSLDAVSVCTWNERPRPVLSIAALKAGKHGAVRKSRWQ